MCHKGDGTAARLALFLVNAHNLGNDFTALLHIEHVALVDVKLRDDVGIVQRGALDDGAAQQHRIQIGHGGDDTRAAHLERYRLQPCAFALGSELVGYRPAWRLGGGSQVELLVQGIDFEHQTIGGDRQTLALHVPVTDKVLHGFDAGQDGHLARFESPALERHDAVVVGVERQVVAQQEIENRIQTAARNLGAVLQLERAGGSVARVGKQGLLVELALLVQFLKTLPRQDNLATHLKLVGQVDEPRDFQRHRLDGDDIGGHVVALHAVAAGHGAHQPPVFIGHRDGRAVILHLAHNLAGLTTQAVLGAAQEVLHFLDAVTVGQGHHGTLVAHLGETLADVAAHALGGGQRVLVLGIIPFQVLQFAQQGVKFLVAHRGGVQHVVVVVVAVDDFPQFLDSLFK